MQSGRTTRYLSLVSESAHRTAARDFADSEIAPGVTRVGIQERDREPLLGTLPGNGYRLLVDAFIESRARARVVTWRIDIRRPSDADPWRIVEQERLTGVENLYRLSLNPGKQYDARNLTISAPDLEFTLPAGSVFVAETDQGVTGLVLLGRGDMRFHPAPLTEKTQVKIFCGSETLDTHFDALFIRINPSDFEQRIAPDRLTARAARSLLQRGRPRRLRHPRLQHRPRLRARARVDGRPRPAAAEDPLVRRRDAHPEAGRAARGAVDCQRSVRPPLRRPRPQPEQ